MVKTIKHWILGYPKIKKQPEITSLDKYTGILNDQIVFRGYRPRVWNFYQKISENKGVKINIDDILVLEKNAGE